MVTGGQGAGSDDDRAALGRMLTDHDVESAIGSGQHGVVWRARHRQLRRPVAVKQLAVVTDEHAARFRREARVLASIDHPHVVSVYDYREDGDQRVIVMELLAGGTLADRFRDGATPESVVASVLAAASGLAQVHAQGILHRDVKPENLLFDDRGRLVVTDFGLAREDQLDATSLQLTHAGSFFGTPAYAAPEQVGAAMASGWPPISAASDEYSLAAVLYEGLSGQRTHDERGGAVAFCNRRMHEEARPLSLAAPEVPDPIAEVVTRALRRDPAERFADCEAFGVALAGAATEAWGPGWLEGSDVPLLAPGPILGAVGGPGAPRALGAPGAVTTADPPPANRGRRWPLLAGVGAALAVVAVGAVVLIGPGRDDGTDDRVSGNVPGATAVIDPVEVWSVRTGAPVISSPAVGEIDGSSRVVVGSRDFHVYALDPGSRTVIWKHRTDGQVVSSPALDRDTVYVGSNDGHLYALSLDDGSVRWRAPTGVELASSPAVHDGVVVIGADHLLAFDADTGEPLWTAETGDVVISSPAVVDGTVYVGTNAGEVLAVALADGSRRWERSFDEPVRSSPEVHEDAVLIGGDDGTLRALDRTTGRDLWTADLGAPIVSSPTVEDGIVVVGTGGGRLVALAVDDGDEVWSVTLPGRLDSSPLALDGRIAIGGVDGRVHLVDAATGDRLGSFTTGDPVLSSPAAVGHRVVVGSDDGSIYLIGGLEDP
jgi:outer membrane protein assembly factor BamB